MFPLYVFFVGIFTVLFLFNIVYLKCLFFLNTSSLHSHWFGCMHALYGANIIHKFLPFRGFIAYMVGDVTRGAGPQFFTEREKSPFLDFATLRAGFNSALEK